MNTRSVFHEEWRRSLREQFKHVARNDDRVTLRSLTAVMLGVGFREDELAKLRLEATLHVDDVAEGFRADMKNLDEPAARAHPAECLCPDCAPVDESQFDADGQPKAPDPEADDDETGRVFPTAGGSELAEPAERAPLTFEDGVTAEADLMDAARSEADEAEDARDPDAPAQMNLF